MVFPDSTSTPLWRNSGPSGRLDPRGFNCSKGLQNDFTQLMRELTFVSPLSVSVLQPCSTHVCCQRVFTCLKNWTSLPRADELGWLGFHLGGVKGPGEAPSPSTRTGLGVQVFPFRSSALPTLPVYTPLKEEGRRVPGPQSDGTLQGRCFEV